MYTRSTRVIAATTACQQGDAPGDHHDHDQGKQDAWAQAAARRGL